MFTNGDGDTADVTDTLVVTDDSRFEFTVYFEWDSGARYRLTLGGVAEPLSGNRVLATVDESSREDGHYIGVAATFEYTVSGDTLTVSGDHVAASASFLGIPEGSDSVTAQRVDTQPA